MKLDRLARAATDLTLVFGAESFIEECAGASLSDPDGRICLATLIDLVVNCDYLGLTLPGQKQQSSSGLAPYLADYVSELPDGRLRLSDTTRAAAAREFVNFARAKGWSWLAQWAQFQLTSPIVNSGHQLRLGGSIVSREGVELWQEFGEVIKDQLAWNPLVQVGSIPLYVKENLAGIEAVDFALAYSLDVYQRGWQYAQRVSSAGSDVAYVPHSLRGNCLEMTTEWSQVQFNQDRLWSWGKYVCAVLSDDDLKTYRCASEVAKLISRIKTGVNGTGIDLTWPSSGVLDEGDRIADPKYLAHIQKCVLDVAKHLGLPLLKQSSSISSAASDLASIATEEAISALENATGLFVMLPIQVAKIAGSVASPESVVAVETKVEEVKRKVGAQFFKASVGYGPLVPDTREGTSK